LLHEIELAYDNGERGLRSVFSDIVMMAALWVILVIYFGTWTALAVSAVGFASIRQARRYVFDRVGKTSTESPGGKTT
jgi:hypothetical protein